MNLTVGRPFERKCIGIMGMALPFLCWASCLLTPFKPSGWCDSMSATYYNSPVLSMGLANLQLPMKNRLLFITTEGGKMPATVTKN